MAGSFGAPAGPSSVAPIGAAGVVAVDVVVEKLDAVKQRG